MTVKIGILQKIGALEKAVRYSAFAVKTLDSYL